MWIIFKPCIHVETVENHGCGKGEIVIKNVETMPNGNVNHAWPVQYGEKWCGKRENGMEIMVFQGQTLGFSTGKNPGADKPFLLFHHRFHTLWKNRCGEKRNVENSFFDMDM